MNTSINPPHSCIKFSQELYAPRPEEQTSAWIVEKIGNKLKDEECALCLTYAFHLWRHQLDQSESRLISYDHRAELSQLIAASLFEKEQSWQRSSGGDAPGSKARSTIGVEGLTQLVADTLHPRLREDWSEQGGLSPLHWRAVEACANILKADRVSEERESEEWKRTTRALSRVFLLLLYGTRKSDEVALGEDAAKDDPVLYLAQKCNLVGPAAISRAIDCVQQFAKEMRDRLTHALMSQPLSNTEEDWKQALVLPSLLATRLVFDEQSRGWMESLCTHHYERTRILLSLVQGALLEREMVDATIERAERRRTRIWSAVRERLQEQTMTEQMMPVPGEETNFSPREYIRAGQRKGVGHRRFGSLIEEKLRKCMQARG